MTPLLEAARRFDLVTIEDASESLGARYKGEPVGTLGDVACFSFNANKVITCGGGGMVVTRNAAWAARARFLTTQAKVDEIESSHDAVGFNYRLTNLQAALGCSQMELLPSYLTKKRELRDRYRKRFAGLPGISLPAAAGWAKDSAWLTAIRVDAGRFGLDRRALAAGLAEARIQTRPLWEVMHRSAAHPGAQVLGGSVAMDLQENVLCLPSSVGLSLGDVDRIVACISEFEIRRGGR
jgi:perosamine synthetase